MSGVIIQPVTTERVAMAVVASFYATHFVAEAR